MDETEAVEDKVTVGDRLRIAREAKKLSLEDVAAQTRIPRRHLESLEASDWEHLPAPTYTVGFAKSYAAAIGLDRAEIGDQLREEMGGLRPVSTAPEVFEPADPARTMPKWLVLGAIGAIILVVLAMTIMNRRSLDEPDAVAEQPVAEAPAPAPAPPPAQATGPVVLTAIGPAWIQVTDQGKTLFSGELAPGQTYAVPATATAPLLKAGKPEALRINVGSAVAPPVGPAGVVASNVSLLPADLMKTPGAPATAAPAAPAVQSPPPPAARPAPQQTSRPRRRTPPPPAAQPAPPPPTVPPAVQTNAG